MSELGFGQGSIGLGNANCADACKVSMLLVIKEGPIFDAFVHQRGNSYMGMSNEKYQMQIRITDHLACIVTLAHVINKPKNTQFGPICSKSIKQLLPLSVSLKGYINIVSTLQRSMVSIRLTP